MHRPQSRPPSLWSSLVELLFPRFCLACESRLAGPGGGSLLLCPVCRGRLAPIALERACTGCLRPLVPGARRRPRCLPCRIDPPPFDLLVAAWRYLPPLEQVIHALKFRRLDFLASDLVDEAIPRAPWLEAEPIDLVVPTPLAPLRRASRGFNQAHLLAAAIARHLGVPCRSALRRARLPTAPQARLSGRRRRGRLGSSIRLRSSAAGRLGGRRVLLVDDVVTTGATLRASAAALRTAHPSFVAALAFAYTPAERASSPPQLP